MIHRRFAASALLLALVCFGIPVSSGNQQERSGQRRTLAEAQAKRNDELARNVISVSRVLHDAGIEIEAWDLFSAVGRKKVQAQLDRYPQMHASKTWSAPLRGVVMADTLTLSAELPIEENTVVLAGQIIFNGSAPTLKGPHDIHLFAFQSIRTADGSIVTIDASGVGRKEWFKASAHHPNLMPGADGVDGKSGKDGKRGFNGGNGDPGSCATNPSGLSGNTGGSGGSGESGENGTNGANGTEGHHITVVVPNNDLGMLRLISRGGDGGRGGAGGSAGNGGRGGNGGNGGDGVGCKCQPNGMGDGGPGGPAGPGGPGGAAGNGGHGGNGGAGGNMVVYYPSGGFDVAKIKTDSRGGFAGLGGHAGSSAVGGAEGNPGSGGLGGIIPRCGGNRNGATGTTGVPGVAGVAGEAGKPGRSGDTGSLVLLPYSEAEQKSSGRPL